MTSPVGFGLVLAACVLAQAFFVAAEIAFSTCSRVRLRKRAAGGARAAALAERMAAEPSVTLATTLVGSNAASLVAVLLVAIFLAERGVHPAWAAAIAAPGMIVLGQLVPKGLASAHADRLVVVAAAPLALASWLLRPLVWLVGGFAGAVTRMAGTDRKQAFVTRDELALLIESEPETDQPQITADEREMIANVFELSGMAVRDLMVPLSEVTALPEDTPMAEAALEVADKRHSRLPIYRSRVDDIVGIVHVFDVLQATASGGDGKTVADAVRPVGYVPETMKAIDLLVELQAEGQHLAIVVDEYGGAVGIVTTEDLLETIVGDIDDEYDDEPSPIRPERPGVWRVEARTPVARVNARLDLGLPESGDYETLASLLIEGGSATSRRCAAARLGAVILGVVAATDRAIETVPTGASDHAGRAADRSRRGGARPRAGGARGT
ncbi:MAG: hemolysin family protein [Kofleriaceae bacterium]